MRNELTEIGRTAERYVTEHLHQFDPFHWQDPETTKIRRKAFSELALYLYLQEHHGGSTPEIREYVATQVNDSRYAKLLRRYPGHFSQIGFPAIVMHSLGELQPETTRAVEETLRNPHLWGKERRPYQLVVLLTKCRLWGYDGHNHDLASVLETSNLVHPPDVIMASEDEFYGLTHNVMLPTFFGTDHPELLAAPLPYDVELAITGGLLRFMAEGNADAVIELLITGVLQRQLPDRLLQYAVRWVYEEKTTDTHVVAPTDSGSDDSAQTQSVGSNAVTGSENSGDEWGVNSRTWSRHYHTNIIAGSMVSVLEDTLDLTSYEDDVVLSSTEFQEMLALGRALNQLSSYDLGPAAETLSGLSGRTFEQFPDVSDRIVDYLEGQRSEDAFGYWVDERRLYERNAGDGSEFDEKLVDPISEKCRTTISDISSSLPVTQSDR